MSRRLGGELVRDPISSLTIFGSHDIHTALRLSNFNQTKKTPSSTTVIFSVSRYVIIVSLAVKMIFTLGTGEFLQFSWAGPSGFVGHNSSLQATETVLECELLTLDFIALLGSPNSQNGRPPC